MNLTIPRWLGNTPLISTRDRNSAPPTWIGNSSSRVIDREKWQISPENELNSLAAVNVSLGYITRRIGDYLPCDQYKCALNVTEQSTNCSSQSIARRGDYVLERNSGLTATRAGY